MLPFRYIIKRSLTTEKPDIGQIFIQDNVQKLLKDITRFEEAKVFARRVVPKLRTPKMMFMSEEQLERAKNEAYENANARLQMPPVMSPDNSKPKVISKDEDIVGYTKFKIMFVDIGPGNSNRSRIMTVREPDGTLRYPSHEERSRLNHIFYPSSATIDPPKLFEEKNLVNLLEKQEYVYILNRACIQFEPDDPRYVDITTRVYTYIDSKGDFDKLRSTRHFGPMSLFFVYNKLADNLLLEMLTKNLIEDAVKLIQLHYTCHDIE